MFIVNLMRWPCAINNIDISGVRCTANRCFHYNYHKDETDDFLTDTSSQNITKNGPEVGEAPKPPNGAF